MPTKISQLLPNPNYYINILHSIWKMYLVHLFYFLGSKENLNIQCSAVFWNIRSLSNIMMFHRICVNIMDCLENVSSIFVLFQDKYLKFDLKIYLVNLFYFPYGNNCLKTTTVIHSQITSHIFKKVVLIIKCVCLQLT